MPSPLDAATCAGEELILFMKHYVPDDIKNLWCTTGDIVSMLNDGGIAITKNKKQLGNVIGNQKRFDLERNNYNKNQWYIFGDTKQFDAPRDQVAEFKERERPQIQPNYFCNLGIKFKFIEMKSKSQPTNSGSSKNSSRHTTATSAATSPVTANNNNNKNNNNSSNNTSDINNNNNNNNSNNNSTEINSNNNNKTPIVSPDNNKANNNNNESRDESNTKRANTSSRQSATSDTNDNNNKTKQSRSCRPDVPSTETGFFISRFDLVDDIAAAAADHRKNCPCDLIKTQRKSGFEVFFELECNFKGCKKKYHIRSGPEEPSKTKTPPATTEQQRRGAKVNQLNMIMTSAAHKSAIPTSHFLDFCHEVGCVSPSEKGLLKMMEKRKHAVKTVAEEVIRSNRREHVAMAKKIYGEDNVIKCTDADGMVHYITRGAVCADGAGDKRAYNHRITGSMHSTVVFSMLTGRVIAVRHDQVSCGLCDRQLTKLLRLNKRADEITDDDLKHDGECSRNSKHNPAVAEEHACELIARDLLVDPATGKLRPDDEAILVDCFISDGDTKGAKRFIATQASIVPEFNEIAIYLPDIGHFIKCISNALHKLAGSNSTLRGVSLLEATRIKSICSDITGILKDYGRESKRIKATLNNDDDVNEQLTASREKAMKRIKAIVPHHCNDHSGCSINDCYVIKRQRERVICHKVMNPNSTKSDEEIIEESAAEVAELHAKHGRFRGKHMSMGKKGQAAVMKEITDRLDFDSIDRVATISSSNRCENFFSVVAKYTHGKRLYYGRTDTFEVIQLYVAMTINNNKVEIENKIRKILGVTFESSLRDAATTKAIQVEEYHKQNKKSAKVIKRRSESKIASTAKTSKHSKEPKRHKTDKLSPKEDCKSNTAAAKPKVTRKRRKCSNCGKFHKGECQEPTYDKEKAAAAKKKKKCIGHSEEELLALVMKHAF